MILKSNTVNAYHYSVYLQAIGEPPLSLSASVFFAIKGAIAAARADIGLGGPFRFDSPATAENIRKACGDMTRLVK